MAALRTPPTYAAIPGGPPSGTLYRLQASAYDTTTTNSEQRLTYTSTPATTLDLALPPPMGNGAGLSVASGTPTVTWGSVAFASSGGSAFDDAMVSWSNAGKDRGWQIIATQDWLNGSLSYAFPDFSGTSGWDSAWDFPTGVTVDVTLVACARRRCPSRRTRPCSASQGRDRSAPLPPDPITLESSQFSFYGTY